MLEKIIVPVDFSQEAENALWFAAEIGKRKSVPLSIIHCLSESESRSEEEKKIKDLKEKLTLTFGSELACDWELTDMDLVHAIKNRTLNPMNHLLVMGTKGASGLKRILIGSNTVRVISEIKTPVLVIPGVARFSDFVKKGKNRVVLASDLEEIKDESGMNFFEEFLKLMNEPKLRILNVRPKNTTLDYEKRLLRKSLISAFGEVADTEKATVFSNNILHGIQFYLEKNEDTGLIVMISKDTGGLFQRHFTHEMAAMTHYPLLILNE
ncbi:universal stress protein [Algoriphagus taiwanensis]|uniref:UspA domain-containing protein n=1 Tax=Algoriphagus taiwanensis TaxID=1445656 RepID=A0ABQ6Q476_9BACT|nr:hypothetical protein Ataiwa_26170 [Algoriphagus taiwanensis]